MTIESAVMSIVQHPCRIELLVSEYFNPDLFIPEVSTRYEYITAALPVKGTEDMLEHFIFINGLVTGMAGHGYGVHMGRDMSYRMDYILGTDLHIFRNTHIQDPWNSLYH